MRTFIRLIGLAGLLHGSTLLADESLSRRPTAEQIVERLSPPPTSTGGKTRSYRGLQVEGEAPTAPAALPSVSRHRPSSMVRRRPLRSASSPARTPSVMPAICLMLPTTLFTTIPVARIPLRHA